MLKRILCLPNVMQTATIANLTFTNRLYVSNTLLPIHFCLQKSLRCYYHSLIIGSNKSFCLLTLGLLPFFPKTTDLLDCRCMPVKYTLQKSSIQPECFLITKNLSSHQRKKLIADQINDNIHFGFTSKSQLALVLFQLSIFFLNYQLSLSLIANI